MPGTLIVRLPNWLGDTVMAVPVLRSLRAGLPDTRIAAAGPWAALLRGQGLADVLVEYPRAWRGRLRAADNVRDLRPDVALLLPNSFEAAAVALYWGPRRRIGFAGNGRTRLLTDAPPLPSPRRHQVEEYLMLLEPLGVPPLQREPRLTPPPPEAAERAEVRELLEAAGAVRGRGPLVGVHLGAAWGPSKLWPVERVAEFCRLVLADGAVPVLLGTGADGPVADEILARIAVPSLVDRDRPALLPALLTELDALVAGDTGVGHLAAALGTPVVTLFGPTDWRLTAPLGPAAVVRHPVPCAPCFYRTCPIEHPCLRNVAATEVRERLWALAGGRAAAVAEGRR